MFGMDTNQNKIIDLLREFHLIAFKEIELLNLRIAELESLPSRPDETPANGAIIKSATVPSAAGKPEIMNEHQVAECIEMSVATIRRWRLIRQALKFLKIGSAVRYKRADVQIWLDSCPGMR